MSAPRSAARELSAGVAWNTGFTFTKDVLQFGLTMVLARLLTPEIYGQFAFISSITTFVAAISFRNFLSHTLQLRRDEQVDYDLHFTFALLMQTAVFAVMNGVSIWFWYSSLHALAIPLAVMSTLLFLDIPSEIDSRMLERELRWSALRILNIAGFAVGAATSLLIAFEGGGLYALIIPNLIAPLPVIAHLFFGRRWRYSWRWTFAGYREAFRFGVARLFSGLTLQARSLIENTTIAVLMSFAALGIYGRAMGLAQLFIYRFIFLLMASAYPVLTTMLAGTARAPRAGVLLLRAICWGSAAAGLMLSIGADPIIRIVYGPQWLTAIPLVGAAVLSRIAAGYRYAVGSLLLADNQARQCAWLDGLSLILFVVSLSGLVWSVRAFLLFDASVQMAVGLGALWLLSHRSWPQLRPLLAPLGEASLAAAMIFLPLYFAAGLVPSSSGRLAIGVLAVVAFVLMVRLIFSSSMKELVRLLPFSGVAVRILALRDPELSASS